MYLFRSFSHEASQVWIQARTQKHNRVNVLPAAMSRKRLCRAVCRAECVCLCMHVRVGQKDRDRNKGSGRGGNRFEICFVVSIYSFSFFDVLKFSVSQWLPCFRHMSYSFASFVFRHSEQATDQSAVLTPPDSFNPFFDPPPLISANHFFNSSPLSFSLLSFLCILPAQPDNQMLHNDNTHTHTTEQLNNAIKPQHFSHWESWSR